MMEFLANLRFSQLYSFLTLIFKRVDVVLWNRRGNTPPTPHLIKEKTIKKYASKYSLVTFVETGTYLGGMVNSIRDVFEYIYTIEINKELYQRAKKKFERIKKVKVLYGDSAKVLPFVLKKIDTPSLFWLDAHFSGGITGGDKNSTPLLREVKEILLKIKSYVILIDDANLLDGTNGYPKFKDLKEKILERTPGSKIKKENNIVVVESISSRGSF